MDFYGMLLLLPGLPWDSMATPYKTEKMQEFSLGFHAKGLLG